MGHTSAVETCGSNRPQTDRNNYFPDGLHVTMFIYNLKLECLIDTVASVSVFQPSMYFAIPANKRPELSRKCGKLRMGDGGLVTPLGHAKFPLTINGKTVVQRLIVAEVEVPLVVGFDFMREHNCVLDMGKGTITFQGEEISCNTPNFVRVTSPVCKVFVQDTVVVPPCSEMMITGTISDKEMCDSDLLIEPGDSKLHSKGILLAKALVHPKNDEIPMRVINLSDTPQVIYKDTFAGTGQILEGQVFEGQVEGHVRFVGTSCEGQVMSDHLRDLWTACSQDLDENQKPLMKNLLVQYQDVFARHKNDLGQTTLVQHRINTGDALPIKQPLRRLPLAKREAAETEVKRMLDNDIIQPSQSPWASPTVLVPKKDGSIRYCIDFRKLNSVTLKDSYPLPMIDQTLEALRGSKYFSTIDLASGYWQVALHPDDAAKTAFTTPQGLYEFKVMPFGLCNAAATFERLMEQVLRGLHWKTCLIYLDDVIIYSESFEAHIERLAEVFERMRKSGLKISPKKCSLLKEKVSFLGHVVSRDGISTDPSKVESVRDWPVPQNVHDVRSFLGTCSYYRRFILNFASIAKPLHKLTEKNVPFVWNDECQTAFQTLKDSLISAPILGYPDMEIPFILDTDASGFGIGSVLSQVKDGQERVIAYFSRSLSKTERNYCVTRRELLAVVESVKHFHHYLYGTQFTIRTDHGALSWLMNFKNPEAQIARWLEVMSSYNFSIVHRPGRLHRNADGMSRASRPCEPCTYCDRQDLKNENASTLLAMTSDECSTNGTSDETDIPFIGSHDMLRTSQSNDHIISKFVQMKETFVDSRPKWEDVSCENTVLKQYWSQWDRMYLQNGILYRRYYDTKGHVTDQLVLPQSLRSQVLEYAHSHITAGHLGESRTFDRIQQRFYWVGYRNDVLRFCKQCTQCQRRKNPPRKAKAPMKQYLVGAPLERIALDILGPLPETTDGNKFILVIADYFTKWTEAYPMKSADAETVAKILVDEFICKFGLPRQIHSDQGRQFESKLFQSLCSVLQIDKTRTTPFHPASDGLVEKFNSTLENMLSKYVSEEQRVWDVHLQVLMLAYRSSLHESTGHTPCNMMLGREIHLPLDLLYGPSPEPQDIPDEAIYVQELREHLWEVHELARDQMIKASDRQKKQYDHKLYQNRYKAGDLVWLRSEKKVKGKSPKLQLKWDGPFSIKQVISDLTYAIHKLPNGNATIVHHNRLKPYVGTN